MSEWQAYTIGVLWSGLRQRIDALEQRIAVFEASLEARIASLDEASDRYTRAASRAERAGINQRTGERVDGDGGLAAVRMRRGGW